MLQLQIDNPALEEKLTYLLQEKKIQLQDFVSEAIERLVEVNLGGDIPSSHKKELQKRIEKYENIDPASLMDFNELQKWISART